MRSFFSIFVIFILTMPLVVFCHQDSRERHWAKASPDPDRIFLTFYGDPATQRAVTWRTDDSVEKGFVEIGPALDSSGFVAFSQRFTANTELLVLQNKPHGVSGRVHYHSMVFKDLEPEKAYLYRVGDGKKRWSEWIEFCTASSSKKPFSFVYFGDAQNDVLSHWSRVIRKAAVIAPSVSFALHAGDLVNRCDNNQEWAEWFTAGGHLHAQWTGIPVTGNHEYRKGNPTLSSLWRPQFTLPIEDALPESLWETVYSISYQGTQILVLNSNREMAPQLSWLEQQLQLPGFKWRVVTFHHPLFSPRGRKHYEPKVRTVLLKLMDQYSVDLVLQGHDHTYLRGQLPVTDLRSNSDKELNFQTLYVTSVSGPKQYKITEGQLEAYKKDNFRSIRLATNTQFFQVISVNEEKIDYRAYTASGLLYDRAIIMKDANTGRKQIIQKIPDVETRTFENTEPYGRRKK